MTSDKEISAVEDVILTKKRFSKMVEQYISGSRDSSYVDAVVTLCEERGIDPADASKLLTPIIKEKIEAEAVEANLVKGDKGSLPL
jgi:hypothetical protein